jgi:hypothetical protein
VAAHFDKISHMNMVGDMKRYAEFQTAQAIGDKNSGDTLETKLQKFKDLKELRPRQPGF